MIINKAIVLNNIEPAMLSVRAPMGMETKLDVTFYRQNGAPYSQDLAAQLQLTSRTRNSTTSYLMPSIDVINGKARAIIPTDVLDDVNGYRLRVMGTFDGEPSLLAMGTLLPIAGAGLDAMPEDIIDDVDLSFERNENVQLNVKLWNDTEKGYPYDLTATGTTVSANIYVSAGGTLIMPFSVKVLAVNEVELSLTVDQVNALPDACWWSLGASTFQGLTTMCQGSVTVTGTVTPALVTTILNYDYAKPAAAASPVAGQIVHSNVTQNILQVSKIDNDAIDRSATLALVRPGDQVIVGLTTWTVTVVLDAGWLEFTVLPVQQAATVGVTPVTFQRPE